MWKKNYCLLFLLFIRISSNIIYYCYIILVLYTYLFIQIIIRIKYYINKKYIMPIGETKKKTFVPIIRLQQPQQRHLCTIVWSICSRYFYFRLIVEPQLPKLTIKTSQLSSLSLEIQWKVPDRFQIDGQFIFFFIRKLNIGTCIIIAQILLNSSIKIRFLRTGICI